MAKIKQQFKKGDIVICLKFGRDNSDMIAGNKYVVSEVDDDGMIKLKGHPDWWSPERFKKISIVEQDLGVCMKCKRAKATIDYNGHEFFVCEPCYDSLSDFFDNEYK